MVEGMDGIIVGSKTKRWIVCDENYVVNVQKLFKIFEKQLQIDLEICITFFDLFL